MTLGTHAVVGSLVGAVAAHNPVFAGVMGFMSHFLLDAIPHWDYKLQSASQDKENPLNSTVHVNKAFLFDLIKIGFDVVVGALIVFALFYQAPTYIIIGASIGAAAGMAPDFLQFVYFRYPKEPMISLQKFHVIMMHAKSHLNDRPWIGVPFQIALVILAVVIVKTIIL
jgi:hypothetical protein